MRLLVKECTEIAAIKPTYKSAIAASELSTESSMAAEIAASIATAYMAAIAASKSSTDAVARPECSIGLTC